MMTDVTDINKDDVNMMSVKVSPKVSPAARKGRSAEAN